MLFSAAHMPESTIAAVANDPILDRLEDQIAWYNGKSVVAQRYFKRFKIAEIVAAAAIPLLSGADFPYVKWVIAGLGVVITILEGLLHLNQYQQIWTMYRSTCEALKHEKFLYLALAGPYAGPANPRAVLAERVEALVSQEHAQWASVQQQSGEGKSQGA
jgi:hypothetical protein